MANKHYTAADRIKKIFLYLWLVITCLIVLVPVLWMVWASFSKGKLLNSVSLLPKWENFSLDNYRYLFSYKSSSSAVLSDFMTAFMRTLRIAIWTTFGVVLITAMTGYVFSRFRFTGKKQMLLGMMLLQMFPSFMGMIALFIIFRRFGWLNKPDYLSFIYITGAIPVNTFLIRGYLKNIPRSIDEAAYIDGASQTQVFFKLILPLVKPIIGFVAVTAFMSPWMDYMLPFQLLDMEHQTVAIFLYRLTDPKVTLYYHPLHFMAGALMLAIPIMAVQIYFQKYIIYGMASGADKG